MITLSLCSPGWHGLFVLNSQRSSCFHLLSAQPHPLYLWILYTFIFIVILPHLSLSKVKHIYYFCLLCVHITQSSGDSLWEFVFSYHVHPKDQSQQPLSREPYDWPQHLLSVWTGYLDFQWSWENYVLPLDLELCTFWTQDFERRGDVHK